MSFHKTRKVTAPPKNQQTLDQFYRRQVPVPHPPAPPPNPSPNTNGNGNRWNPPQTGSGVRRPIPSLDFVPRGNVARPQNPSGSSSRVSAPPGTSAVKTTTATTSSSSSASSS